MRKWTPAIPLVAALGFSAAVFNRLPADVQLRLDPLLPIGIPNSGDVLPRAIAVVFLPGLAAMLWALFAWGARIKAPVPVLPKWLISETTDANAVARFESTYVTIIFTMLAGIAALHVVMLGSVIGWPTWTLQLFTAAVGLALLVVGNVIPRSRPNWIVGIRTKGTLSSAAVWTKTHRYAGMFMMITGVLVIIASVVAPSYALLVTLAGIVLSLPIAHALGARGDSAGVASLVV